MSGQVGLGYVMLVHVMSCEFGLVQCSSG